MLCKHRTWMNSLIRFNCVLQSQPIFNMLLMWHEATLTQSNKCILSYPLLCADTTQGCLGQCVLGKPFKTSSQDQSQWLTEKVTISFWYRESPLRKLELICWLLLFSATELILGGLKITQMPNFATGSRCSLSSQQRLPLVHPPFGGKCLFQMQGQVLLYRC